MSVTADDVVDLWLNYIISLNALTILNKFIYQH